MLSTVAPGQLKEALRFVSLAPHTLPKLEAEGSAEPFQRGSFPNYKTQEVLLNHSTMPAHTQSLPLTVSLKKLAEPSYYSNGRTHRQPVFLHPRRACGWASQLAHSGGSLYTSSFPKLAVSQTQQSCNLPTRKVKRAGLSRPRGIVIRLLSRQTGSVFATFALGALVACGGHSRGGGVNTPATVRLSPATALSLTIGTSQNFTATAQNSAGQSIAATFTFQSSDAGILNFSPNGTACAGTWNAPLYTVCTPQGTGVVQVTATADNVSSPPTFVFVHDPVDQIQVSLVPQTNPPAPCTGQQNIPPACTPLGSAPISGCYTVNQPQTLQATAYSLGRDITASVGPFNWTSGTTGVVSVVPIISNSTKVATNQATASPSTPGVTQVTASAAGSTSQPYSFETCPVQCVALQVSTGSQQSGQTSFITSKGTGETLRAWAVDVQGCIVPKPALTWTSSQPASVLAGGASGCAAGTTCALTTPQPGSASISASCTPPTCNAGFPLGAPGGVAPLPVYPVTAISGLVTGAPGTFNLVATSNTCGIDHDPNCAVSLYSLPVGKNSSGFAVAIPHAPDSLQFDLAGDRAFMGSPYGAMVVAPGNFGTSNSAFTSIPAAGTQTGLLQGKLLAVAPRGNYAVFAGDAVSAPNLTYVVNAINSPTSTALNISGATAAAFSRDGLKAFIVGFDQQHNPKLFVYSTVQALQTFDLPATNPVQQIQLSASDSFAFLNGGSATSSVSVRNVCNNLASTDVNNVPPVLNLPAQPLMLKAMPPGNFPMGNNIVPQLQPEGLDFLLGVDNTGIDIIATSATQPAQNALCPQTIALPRLQQNPAQTFAPVHINIGQGTFHPVNFFVSPDETLVYIVASDFASVLVYNLNTNSTGAIALVNVSGTPFPLSADMTPDGSYIYIAASDGLLHGVSTSPAADVFQISFPFLANSTNSFCSNPITTPNCSLNMVAIQP